MGLLDLTARSCLPPSRNLTSSTEVIRGGTKSGMSDSRGSSMSATLPTRPLLGEMNRSSKRNCWQADTGTRSSTEEPEKGGDTFTVGVLAPRAGLDTAFILRKFAVKGEGARAGARAEWRSEEEEVVLFFSLYPQPPLLL